MNLHRSIFAAFPLTVGLSHALPSAAAPPTLSYFCQSSVMDTHKYYVTGVFTVTAQTDAVAKAWREHIAATDPKARQTALCQGAPDAAGVENLKKLNVTSMAQLNLSVVDIAWAYSPSAAPIASPAVANAKPVTPPTSPVTAPSVAAPPPVKPPAVAPAAPVAAASTAPAAQGKAYYCYAQSSDIKYVYYTAVHPLDYDIRDVRSAWVQWANPSNTPHVPDDEGRKPCVFSDPASTQYMLDMARKGTESNVRQGGPSYHLIDVNWKYTPDQLALVSKPDAQYGFCYEQRQSPTTTYMSGSFEMPMEDVMAENRVMFAEFAKDNAQRYGIPLQIYDPSKGACVQQGNATAAEANRKNFETSDFAKQSKIVETGWKFVRTAQTPPPGPPRVQ